MPRGADSVKQETLMRGVLVLVPAALFSKLVGLFYKIPLIHIVGVQGMAYFLAAYHLYSLFFLLSSTGLPTALSLQIARARSLGLFGAVRRVLGVSLVLFFVPGLFGALLLFVAAPRLAARLAMPGATEAILAIAPALALAAFLGAAKGYFQGHHKMGATALSEVLEACGKLGFGLFFALLAKRRGCPAPTVAAYAIFGITVGMALACAVLGVMLVCHLARTSGEKGTALPTRRAVLFELLRVALPITASAAVIGLVSLLDTALISARLQAAGFAPPVADAMYSSYGNLAIPLYNLVPSLLSPVTLALMPLMGAYMARGEHAGACESFAGARRFTLLVAIPAAMGLAVFAHPLLSLIYAGQEEAISVAAPLLSLLALSVLPSALLTLTGACLQATGHTLLPVVATGAGAAVKLIAESVLLTLPGVYITGAPISTLLCTLTVLVIEIAALCRYLPFEVISARELLRPFFAALPAVALGIALYLMLLRLFGEGAYLMPAVLGTVLAVWLPLALLLRAVERRDLLALPAGERVCCLLERCKLLK